MIIIMACQVRDMHAHVHMCIMLLESYSLHIYMYIFGSDILIEICLQRFFVLFIMSILYYRYF